MQINKLLQPKNNLGRGDPNCLGRGDQNYLRFGDPNFLGRGDSNCLGPGDPNCLRRDDPKNLGWARLHPKFLGRLWLHFFGSFWPKNFCSVIITSRLVSRAVTHSLLERDGWGSNLGQVKSIIVLQTAYHRCDISAKGAVLPGLNDAEMDPINSLHASTYYSDCNERFDW